MNADRHASGGKNEKPPVDPEVFMVGMTGFEPATPSSLTKCATKLRYIPMPAVI